MTFLQRIRATALRAIGSLLRPISYGGGWGTSWWWPHETGTGTWQTNTATTDSAQTLLTFPVVFACVTGIAQDVSKLPIKLVRKVGDIWEEISEAHGNSKYSAAIRLLKTPNHYQTLLQFLEHWVISKLLSGNAYVLKQRDRDRNVVALYVLDPCRVVPLIAQNGDLYYRLDTDNLSNLEDGKTVPASEIIHDKMVGFWHPLVGVSPLTACALAATVGNKIGNHQALFFQNRAMPGGLLTAEGAISNEAAARIKAAFETAYGGENIGKIAVLGDGLKFKPLLMTAENAQLADTLKMAREDVAMVFHYPLYKLGLATVPYANGPQSAQMLYYTDCLQPHLEQMERCLDKGLEFSDDVGTEFDTDVLLRMDSKTLVETNQIAVQSAQMSPNEARKTRNLPKKPGGDALYMQEQNFSLEALAKRDAKDDPFSGTSAPDPEPEPSPDDDGDRNVLAELEAVLEATTRGLETYAHL